MQNIQEKYRVIEKLARDMEPLMVYLHDEDINEVMLNSNSQIWVDNIHQGKISVDMMDAKRAESIVHGLAGMMGKLVSIERPFLETDLPHGYGLRGERFTAQMPPVVTRPSFTIRKRSRRIFTLEDYVTTSRLTPNKAKRIQQWIADRKNIIVAGSPGSGKTTVMNALIEEAYIANPKERFFLLEDVSELRCRGENTMPLLTSPPFVTMSNLLLSATRSSPERILVGEVRGGEAYDMLKAWNVGCSGGIGTIHANGIDETIQRVMDLCLESGLTSPPINLMRQTLHAIIHVTKKGSQSGYISDLALITGYQKRAFQLQHINEAGE